MSRFAVLDNNKQVTRYNAAASIGDRPYNDLAFKYIGDGYIYSCEGVEFPANSMRCSFFVLRANRPRWLK